MKKTVSPTATISMTLASTFSTRSMVEVMGSQIWRKYVPAPMLRRSKVETPSRISLPSSEYRLAIVPVVVDRVSFSTVSNSPSPARFSTTLLSLLTAWTRSVTRVQPRVSAERIADVRSTDRDVELNEYSACEESASLAATMASPSVSRRSICIVGISETSWSMSRCVVRGHCCVVSSRTLEYSSPLTTNRNVLSRAARSWGSIIEETTPPSSS